VSNSSTRQARRIDTFHPPRTSKAFILKQSRDGMPVAGICRKAGISEFLSGRAKSQQRHDMTVGRE